MIGAWRNLFAMSVICFAFLVPVKAVANEVLVFAAASLKTALDEISEAFAKSTEQDVVISYAASSVLARQIQLGAPADIFVSANAEWMDVLQQQGLIDTSSRVDLLGNRLVLIGAPDRPTFSISSDLDLRAQLNGRHLAMALVEAVPAGIYGKAALQGLGQWEGVQDQVAQADNVRAALALVATGAVPLGIVYTSDAVAEERVRVVAEFPSNLHPQIIYPAALTSGAQQSAEGFLDFLQSETAQAIFLRQGFTLPNG